MNDNPSLCAERAWKLFHAAADFFLLQDRSYPRAAALEMAGNRYALCAPERQVLQRGVFDAATALSRRAKRAMGSAWQDSLLAVDGHNVQITVESFIEGRLLLRANDGAVRDIAGQSSRFRFSETGAVAVDMIFRFLREFPPERVLFLFDAPMAHSGELAAVYRDRMRKAGLRGDARAVPVPEREIPFPECVAASSDRAVLDAGTRWIDLAGRVMDHFGPPVIEADFSSLVSRRRAREFPLRGGGPFW